MFNLYLKVEYHKLYLANKFLSFFLQKKTEKYL
jgi:hypothetical protein